jgi:alkanesulfonate monooxygenase SsuD/methylene tetrahydromethanopterin reductase-like flavin-dependent oxidoreductase (luciferase family)
MLNWHVELRGAHRARDVVAAHTSRDRRLDLDTDMRFAISLPQYARGPSTAEMVRNFVTRAEELSFDSAWTQELVLGPAPWLSPLETMTWAAAHTTSLRLGCSLFILPRQSPVYLAKALTTLDVFSEGRVEVGVGLGDAGSYPAYGITGEGRVTRFLEYVGVMKSLWTEPTTTLKGRFLQLEDEAMEPKPVQRPHPPLWFGGTAPAALARAVRHADGWFGAGRSSTEQFAGHMTTVRKELTEQGRDPGSLQIAKRVYVAVDDDAGRAGRRVKERLSAYYQTGEDLGYMAVFGPPERCVEGLQDVISAGADLVLLTPMFDEVEQMERLAEEVIPALG